MSKEKCNGASGPASVCGWCDHAAHAVECGEEIGAREKSIGLGNDSQVIVTQVRCECATSEVRSPWAKAKDTPASPPPSGSPGAAEIDAAFARVEDEARRIVHAPTASKSGEVKVVDPKTGGVKGSKLARFDLVPARPLWLIAEHYGKGAKKYSPNNWRRGYAWGLSVAAAERHLNLFKQGQNFDSHEADCPADCLEHTGSHHLVAATWHLLGLIEFTETYPQGDDRVVGLYVEKKE